MTWYFFKEKIKDIFYYNPMYGIPKLINWFKTIYNDRDWTNYYIYAILIKKLENQEKHLRKYDNANNKADEIAYIISLLKKIQEDNYGSDDFDEHDKKWGHPEFDFVLDEESFKQHNGNMYEIKMKYDKDLSEEEKEQEREEYYQIGLRGEEQRKKDIAEAFELIGKQIDEWY